MAQELKLYGGKAMADTQVNILVFFVLTTATALAYLTIAKHIASRPSLPIDCEDIQSLGFNTTDIYVIYPAKTKGVRVRCDMETEGGGWTVIQRRAAGSNFYRSWNEYEIGFGDLGTNFWMGNKQISRLTSQSWYHLRIDMTHANGTIAYAGYNVFEVGDTTSKYQLTVSGYHGNAGDAMTGHNGYSFTTKDRDNDVHAKNCAVEHIGAWWYTKCHSSNLNGDYGNIAYADGLTWFPFTGYYSSLSAVEMKVKRFQFDLAGRIDGTV